MSPTLKRGLARGVVGGFTVALCVVIALHPAVWLPIGVFLGVISTWALLAWAIFNL